MTILRVDHALRGLLLRPGQHVVEFRYQAPAFWVGLAVSLGTLLTLDVASLGTWRRRLDGSSTSRSGQTL